MESIFPHRKAIHASEYFLSGDYPKTYWDRLNWKGQKSGQSKGFISSSSDCDIENLCVELHPSDLKTFRIEFIGDEPETTTEPISASTKAGFCILREFQFFLKCPKIEHIQ